MTITFNFEEGKSTYTFPITKRPAEGSKAKGSALFQRGFLGGIKVDVASIPRSVLEKLLFDAIEAKLQAAVKKLDQETCTQEEAQAAMKTALEALVSGAKKRPGPTLQTKIRAEARKMLKEALVQLNEASDDPEELDTKALAETVSEHFKAYDTFVKPKTSEALRAQVEPMASIVATFLKAAEQRLAQAAQVGGLLAALKAKQAKGESAETGTTPAPRPTPTEGVKARRKAAASGQGRST